MQNKREKAIILKYISKHKHKENCKMKTLAEKFIGKDCYVYTIANSMTAERGIITEVTDGGLLLEYKGKSSAINLEHITTISEIPQKSKPEKKVKF